MLIKTGKHAGLTTEELLLKMPHWAQWMVLNFPDSAVANSFREVIATFDQKASAMKCANCRKSATRATAAHGSGAAVSCFGATTAIRIGLERHRGTLTTIRRVDDALFHVDMWCNHVRSDKRAIIKELAVGKGLPKRVGKWEAADFLTPQPPRRRRFAYPAPDATSQNQEARERFSRDIEVILCRHHPNRCSLRGR